jgi:hypothetical protein
VTWGGFSPAPIRLGGSATEGWAPEQHARFCADLVAASRVAPLAAWSCIAPNFEYISYYGMNGSGFEHAPEISVDGSGIYSFTWPSPSLEDDYGIQQPFKIRHVIANAHDNGIGGANQAAVVVTIIASGIQVRLRTVGGLLADRAISVSVW